MTRILEKYKEEVRLSFLKDREKFSNVMKVPTLSKVVVNMGIGGALKNDQELNEAQQDLTLITGQKPYLCRARRSVATWRLREGNPIGCKVTLRGRRMWEFVDRLVSLAIPRIKDFRGLNRKSFDGRGNYNLGINEKAIFPEVNQDRMQFKQGMDICIVTTADNNEDALKLLQELGFPFKKQ
jgi:large subunit ribosomal protein L5